MGFLNGIEEQLWSFLESFYHAVGWLGVVAMMAIENACIPLPSEVVLPLAGQYLVGSNDNWPAILLTGLCGALGCTIGSALAYRVGASGGRWLVEKYGKHVLIRASHLHTADEWFSKYGEATAFFSRLLPVIRTFISFPAGVARMNIGKFLAYTFAGSFIWSAALAWAGATWQPRAIREALRPFDVPIALAVLALIAVFVVRSWRNRNAEAEQQVALGRV